MEDLTGYEDRRFWDVPPSVGVGNVFSKENGWVTEEFDGHFITYNKKFMNWFVNGTISYDEFKKQQL